MCLDSEPSVVLGYCCMLSDGQGRFSSAVAGLNLQ